MFQLWIPEIVCWTRSVVFILNYSRGQDRIAKIPAQVLGGTNVNLPAQQLGQLHFHASQSKKARNVIQFELYEHVDVSSII